MIDALLSRFPVSPELERAARVAAERAAAIERPSVARTKLAVVAAFALERIAESDFAGSFGYGYDDPARERYESLLAQIFGCERAFARLSLVSGTHAIVAALEALLPRDGRLLSATGRPYDTLRNAIVEAPYALTSRGIRYDEVPLASDGGVDFDALCTRLTEGADVVFVQRSRGYAPRRSLSAEECGAVAGTVKAILPQAIVLVDNCYGELVEEREPTHYGADAVAGSLIKNLGGGLAPGGAYVAGRADLIERVAAHHYAPGLGGGVGPTLGFGRAFLQGLFYAPLVVGEALFGLDFAAALFDELGFGVDPVLGAPRRDVVQAIRLGDAAQIVAFARGLQQAMPVNAAFVPEPGRVPGYQEPVVMSSGAFISGSTIELSCDAPLRLPYEVYLQGGTMREHGMLGALLAAREVVQERNRSVPQKGD
jgi:cystathionine beta-lyase family protein involved in aluminum resistance